MGGGGVYKYIFMNAYTYIYIQIYTYIYTHIQPLRALSSPPPLYFQGQWGGTRAAAGLRPVLSELGCLPVSAMVHVPSAHRCVGIRFVIVIVRVVVLGVVVVLDL